MHRVLLGVSLVLIAGGCGGAPQLPVVPAVGVVKFKGEPLVGATLVFSPTVGEAVATATSDANGSFELVTGEQIGALPGEYKVLVSKYEFTEGTLMPGEHEMTKGTSKLVTPAKYGTLETTDLTLTVPAEGSKTLEILVP